MLADCPPFVVGALGDRPLTTGWAMCTLHAMSLSLLEYRALGKKLSDLARLTGIDKGTLYRIAKGERGCHLDTALKIQVHTNGLVTPADLQRARDAFLDRQAKAAAESEDDDKERTPALAVSQ